MSCRSGVGERVWSFLVTSASLAVVTDGNPREHTGRHALPGRRARWLRHLGDPASGAEAVSCGRVPDPRGDSQQPRGYSLAYYSVRRYPRPDCQRARNVPYRKYLLCRGQNQTSVFIWTSCPFYISKETCS